MRLASQWHITKIVRKYDRVWKLSPRGAKQDSSFATSNEIRIGCFSKKLWCKWTHRGYPDFSEKSVLLKFDELIFKTTGRDHFNWKYDTGRCQLFSLRLLKSSSFVKISFFFPHPEILPFDANYFDAKLFRVTLPRYFFLFSP